MIGACQPSIRHLPHARLPPSRGQGQAAPHQTLEGCIGRPTPPEAGPRARGRSPARIAGRDGGRRAQRRVHRADEGQPLPAGDVTHGRQPGRRGHGVRRRHDPDRVLLRRVGRHPGLHPQGDPAREQAPRTPPRPPGDERRPGHPGSHRHRARRGPGERAVRRDRRPRRGVPDPAGADVHAARPAPRARPAVGRARARDLARRDLDRRLPGAGLAQRGGAPRARRAQGGDAHPASAVGDRAPPSPLHHRRRRRQ